METQWNIDRGGNPTREESVKYNELARRLSQIRERLSPLMKTSCAPAINVFCERIVQGRIPIAFKCPPSLIELTSLSVENWPGADILEQESSQLSATFGG